MNKVVVLGALGLVGRAVIGALEDRRDWEVIGVSRYDLRPTSLEQLVGSSWQFADAVFGYGGAPPDAIVSTVKARRFGFHDCCDTNEMFERQLRHMQALRLLPPLTPEVGS